MNRKVVVLLVIVVLVTVGCGASAGMADQPRSEPLESSDFFADGRAARAPVANTVPREGFIADAAFRTGQLNGEPVTTLPVEMTRELLERGRERYNIYCAPCHSLVGDGQGMIVQRGFPEPPSFHSNRLREAPPGYFFDVITNGFGVMFDYASQVPPGDRWAIIAYIQALQASQQVSADSLPDEDANQLPE